MSAILAELENFSYNLVFVSGWVVGVILLLLHQKRPMILGTTYVVGTLGIFIELWFTHHEFNKWINLIFGLIFLLSLVLQGIFFMSLFYTDKKWYKYFKLGTWIFSIILLVLIVLYMDKPASTDPQFVGIVNHEIIFYPMLIYIIPIMLISVVNLVKMLSHIPKHEQSDIKLLYIGLMIFIFALIIGEIDITTSNFLMVFGFFMTGVAYLRIRGTKAESEEIVEKQRLKSVDSTRGFGIVTIIYAHLFVGLWQGPENLNQWMNDPLLLFMGLFANLASIFFVAAGISAPFSMIKQARNNIAPNVILKNQLIRSLYLIVLGTFYDPLVYGYWGIVDTLQISGISLCLVSLVVYFAYLRHDPTAQNPIKLEHLFKTMLWITVIILILSLPIRVLVGYPKEDPSVSFIVAYATPHNFFEEVQAWLTTGFFPIFPCTAYFFIGAAIGCYLYPNRNNPKAIRKLMRKLLIISGLVLIATLILFFAGDMIISTIGAQNNIDYLNDVPFNDQPWWVIELTLNLQPFTTVGFLLFLFFPLFCLGLFMYIHDIPHGKNVSAVKHFIGKYLGGKAIFNTFRRFSYCSLTIYILQFAWMVILRLIEVFSGTQLLYSEPSLWIVMGWVLISEISFAFFALYFESIQYKYGFEWLGHKLQGRKMQEITT